MLKMVEYGLLAVSLLMVLGLIVNDARKREIAGEDGLENAADVGGESAAAPLGSARRQ